MVLRPPVQSFTVARPQSDPICRGPGRRGTAACRSAVPGGEAPTEPVLSGDRPGLRLGALFSRSEYAELRTPRLVRGLAKVLTPERREKRILYALHGEHCVFWTGSLGVPRGPCHHDCGAGCGTSCALPWRNSAPHHNCFQLRHPNCCRPTQVKTPELPHANPGEDARVAARQPR